MWVAGASARAHSNAAVAVLLAQLLLVLLETANSDPVLLGCCVRLPCAWVGCHQCWCPLYMLFWRCLQRRHVSLVVVIGCPQLHSWCPVGPLLAVQCRE